MLALLALGDEHRRPRLHHQRVPHHIHRVTQEFALTSLIPADLPQHRQLVTPIPGPRSLALAARRAASVAAGVSSSLPVHVERAGGGAVQDVGGSSFIDLRAGIAATHVGNAAPFVVAAVARQAQDFTHTCVMVGPCEEYVAVCEQLARLTPGGLPLAAVTGRADLVDAVRRFARADGVEVVIDEHPLSWQVTRLGRRRAGVLDRAATRSCSSSGGGRRRSSTHHGEPQPSGSGARSRSR